MSENGIVKYEDAPALPDAVSETVKESPMTPYVQDHLIWMRDHHGLPLRESVVSLLVYYLEDIGAGKADVMRMLKAFPRSEEMVECVQYDRSPMPRDFLDVFDRVNSWAYGTKVGDRNW